MNLTPEVRKDLEKLPTGNVADNNPHGYVLETAIKPVNSHVHMIGRAVTVLCQPGDNLAMHQGIYAAEPGDVLVLDCGGYNEAGHFGDIMATAAKLHGLAGVVINGSCRDSQDIYEMGFPMFVKGYNPHGTVKESLAKIGVPVAFGGAVIRPGDIVFGDCDGVVVVPQEDEDEVFQKACAKFDREEQIRQELLAGKTTLEIYGFDKLIEQKQK